MAVKNPPTKSLFGHNKSSESVYSYIIKNDKGMNLRVLNLGAVIQSLNVLDIFGNYRDVVLGYDHAKSYLKNITYFGAVVGRYGNRIANGNFYLESDAFQLDQNNGDHCLHGGESGYHSRIWKVDEHTENSIHLSLISPDGDQGFPGLVNINVSYRVTNDNQLIIEYSANTDRPTPLNLTQHSYFNLDGHSSGTILNHECMIHAKSYLPIDREYIPTGTIESVEHTPFNFLDQRRVKKSLKQTHMQLSIAGGIDHTFVLSEPRSSHEPIACVYSEVSGICMRVYTELPGVQFYTGNFLDSTEQGKEGTYYQKHAGLCLETQFFPNSPNQPSFPSALLMPGERWFSKTVYSFDAIAKVNADCPNKNQKGHP